VSGVGGGELGGGGGGVEKGGDRGGGGRSSLRKWDHKKQELSDLHRSINRCRPLSPTSKGPLYTAGGYKILLLAT